VALIAGTGSHCFGINPSGDVAYAGGLEYVLSDEGSGYDIGLKVLRAAVRSADGRSQHTKLEEAVLQHYKVKSIRALEPIVYHSNQFGKTQIAQLAKLVDSAAATGDWRAQAILAETVTELVAHVRAVVQRLNLATEPFDLVVVGGIFEITAVPLFARFKRVIKTIAPRASLIQPNQPPVWGAIRLAQDQLANLNASR
jgi:N-acetylglucosamine kinase